MRFSFVPLTALSLFLLASPAWAGRLISWRFDPSQNTLSFDTDAPVQPKAQLISDPTRIVIDLPGTYLESKSSRSYNGYVRNIRIGQFDDNTARLVIELAPGYTVDPMQVKVKGISPKQWIVTLPSLTPIDSTKQSQSVNTPSSIQSSQKNSVNIADLQITASGIFINLKRNGNRDGIVIERQNDSNTYNTIVIQLADAVLPDSLANKKFMLNQYGVGQIGFEQSSSGSKINLTVSPDSQDWVAAYSPLGGVLLFPKGGFSNNPKDAPLPSVSLSDSNALATILGVQLTPNNTLLINSDRPIHGDLQKNKATGNYEVIIPNAKLASSPTGLTLNSSSPIRQLRLDQQSNQSVKVLFLTNLGARIEGITQVNPQTLSVEIDTSRLNSGNLPPQNNTQLPALPSSSKHLITREHPLVIIDPGHGGKDAGATGLNDIQEKDIVLSISQQVSQLLSQKGIQVILTRDNDSFVTLQGRADMANKADADLFVSIHANSIEPHRTDINGLEVYYFNDPSLSNTIYQAVTQSVDIRQRGVKQARFYVLRNSRMPSTLVEVGYVTGAEDSIKLSTPTYQTQMANAIANGILAYIQQEKH